MQVWALSDRGRVRATNQDSFYCDANEVLSIALVCDGMGGEAAGDLASRMAAESFVDALGLPVKSIPERMLWAADRANEAVYAYSLENPACKGMGTTLVAAVVRKNIAYVMNIGDSRCYYLDEGGIEQVTRDHSLVANMVARGEITPEEARTHPKKNMITRALGTQEDCRADLFQVELRPNGMLLLCSDGLTNLVTDQELLFQALYGGEPDTLCRRLMDLAMQRGAPDNVTVLFLRADDRGC